MSEANHESVVKVYNVVLTREAHAIHWQYTDFVLKVHNWAIDLDHNHHFSISGRGTEKLYHVADIDEFVFEVEGYGKHEVHTQFGNAYVRLKGDDHPLELFSIPVHEGHKLASRTESYRLTGMILKQLSERYDKPYSYTYSVHTKRKNNRQWFLIGYIVFMFLVMVLYILFKDR